MKQLVWACLLSVFLSTGCLPEDHAPHIPPENFLEALGEAQITVTSLPKESGGELIVDQIPDYEFSGLFETDGVKFSLYDTDKAQDYKKVLAPGLSVVVNENLLLLSKIEPPRNIQDVILSLKPPLTIYDAGIFIYPLGLCLFFAVFIFTERLLSLRRSVTFPRKVEKALKMGEFPSKKWKQKSAAERIVWVALHENPSPESLSSYKNLEVSAMERGFFILEVIISASPLIGLLGTVTGLVQVFSSISDINQGKDVLAEGIGLALLTTILGLAIAIPTLIGHSYLGRILDKRIASLNWVTSRINDARQRNPAEIL